jgi:hypothetical protein
MLHLPKVRYVRNIKITMTLLVRNESDLIEPNIRFHHAIGVDSFIVMDNISTDETSNIVRQLSNEFDIEYIFQTADDYSQSQWVTGMAQHAARGHSADWVINNDADEFWLPEKGDLKLLLASLPSEVSALNVKRHNAVVVRDEQTPGLGKCSPESSTYFESHSVNNLGKPLPGKMLHRALENVIVAQGNHGVSNLQGVVERAENRIKILHFPYCNFEKYKAKIQTGGAAYAQNTTLPKEVGATWRTHYSQLQTEGLDGFWESITETTSNVEKGLKNGRLFMEKVLVDLLKDSENPCRGWDFPALLFDLTDRTKQLVESHIKQQSQFIKRVQFPERAERPMHYNLPFALQGAREQLRQLEKLPSSFSSPQQLASALPQLRDIFSLFPRNTHMKTLLSQLCYLINGPDAQRLRNDCKGKRVILVTNCQSRFDGCVDIRATFDSLSKDEYHLISLLGEIDFGTENETSLSFSYDGQILRVPASDTYEHLHRKLFYAFMLFDRLTQPDMLIKIDDDLMLEDVAKFTNCMDEVAQQRPACAGRVVGSSHHETQLHGWHIGKCTDKVIEQRGYQYPLPPEYPAGGYGYVLLPEGLSACSYMYLAMKEFFEQRAIGLEDAFTGLALNAAGIHVRSINQGKSQLCLPGLITKRRRMINI